MSVFWWSHPSHYKRYALYYCICWAHRLWESRSGLSDMNRMTIFISDIFIIYCTHCSIINLISFSSSPTPKGACWSPPASVWRQCGHFSTTSGTSEGTDHYSYESSLQTCETWILRKNMILNAKIKCFPLIVTLLRPEKIVTISIRHNNRWIYSIKLSFWIPYCWQKLSQKKVCRQYPVSQ